MAPIVVQVNIMDNKLSFSFSFTISPSIIHTGTVWSLTFDLWANLKLSLLGYAHHTLPYAHIDIQLQTGIHTHTHSNWGASVIQTGVQTSRHTYFTDWPHQTNGKMVGIRGKIITLWEEAAMAMASADKHRYTLKLLSRTFTWIIQHSKPK